MAQKNIFGPKIFLAQNTFLVKNGVFSHFWAILGSKWGQNGPKLPKNGPKNVSSKMFFLGYFSTIFDNFDPQKPFLTPKNHFLSKNDLFLAFLDAKIFFFEKSAFLGHFSGKNDFFSEKRHF